MSQADDIWTSKQRLEVLGNKDLTQSIASSLIASGLECFPASLPQTKARVKEIGRAEWNQLRDKPNTVTEYKARWLLGAGYIVTEFLIAPIIPSQPPRAICSLGALLNLMVCLADSQLDHGADIQDVIPQVEVLDHEASTTPVTKLVRLYWQELEKISIHSSLHALMQNAFRRMVSAEIATIRLRQRATYCTWLQKSALPVVLMGLPAWRSSIQSNNSGLTLSAYVRWVYQVGRIFGILDDASDYGIDISEGNLNYFVPIPSNKLTDEARKAASSIAKFISWWDMHSNEQRGTSVIRTDFLNLIWQWLS